MTRQLRIALSASGEIALIIPSPTGSEHTVEVPCSEEGLRILRDTLRRFTDEPEARIGSRGHLTQWQVDRLMREFKPQPKAANGHVVDLDLDLSNLTL